MRDLLIKDNNDRYIKFVKTNEGKKLYVLDCDTNQWVEKPEWLTN